MTHSLITQRVLECVENCIHIKRKEHIHIYHGVRNYIKVTLWGFLLLDWFSGSRDYCFAARILILKLRSMLRGCIIISCSNILRCPLPDKIKNVLPRYCIQIYIHIYLIVFKRCLELIVINTFWIFIENSYYVLSRLFFFTYSLIIFNCL